MSYYYYGNDNVIHGPFSEKTYAKWYANRDVPTDMTLFDHKKNAWPIAHVVEKYLKSQTKIIFADKTFADKTFADATADHTQLDVTLDMNQTYRNNESTFLHPDFTQIDEEVDEVDCGGGLSEHDSQGVHLLKMVGVYLDRRAFINRRRRFPDNYVPFEMPWSTWVPNPLAMSDALRGTVHLHNCLQEYDADIFSAYLATLNIFAHPCQRCHVDFENAHEMLAHFVSIPHVHRMYSQESPQMMLSMIDVYCVQKMMSEVEALEEADGDVHLEPFEPVVDAPPTFFDSADVSQAFDSLKSTVMLMQKVPLLEAARETSDTCEYIEALVLLRAFESNYVRIHPRYRHRRFGSSGKTKCTCCDVEFDAMHLESLPKHLFSEEHLYNALALGISRTELEYWLSFLRTIAKGVNSTDWRYQRAEKSLQESDFPLCYQLSDLSHGDFVYSGGDVEPVLNFVRNKIRDHLPLLDDFKYRTTCRWCRTELCSKNDVLRHVLYDKSHVDRLKHVSNDDLRRLLKVLDLQTTMPLFQESLRGLHGAVMTGGEKTAALQKLKNVAWLKHKRREIWATAARSFPMGLVNRCELCRADVEHVDGIIMHLCSEQHARNLVDKARIVNADFDYWMQIFQVNDARRSR